MTLTTQCKGFINDDLQQIIYDDNVFNENNGGEVELNICYNFIHLCGFTIIFYHEWSSVDGIKYIASNKLCTTDEFEHFTYNYNYCTN